MAAPLTSRRLGRGLVAATLLAGAVVLGATAFVVSQPGPTGPVAAQPTHANRGDVTLFVGDPSTLDPARQSDLGSAIVINQVFEGLTAFDPGLNVRPAIASSWDILDGGRRIVFHIRPDAAFSDGTPLRGADVVRSWLRLIDPRAPSPLVSLMEDVVGAIDFARGRSADPSSVGLRVVGDAGTDLEVRLTRPANEFVGVVASTSFAIVPPRVGSDPRRLLAEGFVGSGGYVLTSIERDRLELRANPHYWAGPPAIPLVHLVTTLAGRDSVAAFRAGEVDYVGVADGDASWIRFDRTLGASLRQVPSLGVQFYGFDTARPPFNDANVRRAFAQAVDWDRLVRMAGPASTTPANSMVPPGVPNHPTRDFSPTFDVEAAQRALAQAGYPGGAGFPEVTLVTDGGAIDAGVIAQVQANLGVTLRREIVADGSYFARLSSDVPAFWVLSWIADYPGANDFLGLLLGTGRSNNYGSWSSAEFDAAIASAGSATSPEAAETAYEQAQLVVQRDAPVIPVIYGSGWALVRGGLLGTAENGLGLPRLAGLAWSP